MGYDVAGAEQVAAAWHARLDALAPDTAAPTQRLVDDSATRADERHGDLVVGQEQVRAEFEAIAARYQVAKQALADANSRLTALAAQRSTALQAVQAARGSDVALNQARLAESGQLGSQIDALSQRLARQGDTVQGTGTFAHPLDGVITSPFGMRFHPILHYIKLHTGTDFAGGSVIHAADDGRVLMTVVSTAYGNFTVIDHGMRRRQADHHRLRPPVPVPGAARASGSARATRSASLGPPATPPGRTCTSRSARTAPSSTRCASCADAAAHSPAANRAGSPGGSRCAEGHVHRPSPPGAIRARTSRPVPRATNPLVQAGPRVRSR